MTPQELIEHLRNRKEPGKPLTSEQLKTRVKKQFHKTFISEEDEIVRRLKKVPWDQAKSIFNDPEIKADEKERLSNWTLSEVIEARIGDYNHLMFTQLDKQLKAKMINNSLK